MTAKLANGVYPIDHTVDELLASVMRKIVEQRGGWVALYTSSAFIDGWVENLTTDEVVALENLGLRRES